MTLEEYWIKQDEWYTKEEVQESGILGRHYSRLKIFTDKKYGLLEQKLGQISGISLLKLREKLDREVILGEMADSLGIDRGTIKNRYTKILDHYIENIFETEYKGKGTPTLYLLKGKYEKEDILNALMQAKEKQDKKQNAIKKNRFLKSMTFELLKAAKDNMKPIDYRKATTGILEEFVLRMSAALPEEISEEIEKMLREKHEYNNEIRNSGNGGSLKIILSNEEKTIDCVIEEIAIKKYCEENGIKRKRFEEKVYGLLKIELQEEVEDIELSSNMKIKTDSYEVNIRNSRIISIKEI